MVCVCVYFLLLSIHLRQTYRKLFLFEKKKSFNSLLSVKTKSMELYNS